MSAAPRRCLLVFSRAPRAEARAKRLRGAELLFELALRRLAAVAAALPQVDLLVVGPEGDGNAGSPLVQRGRSFEDRLRNAFEDARGLGYRHVVAVPGDVPGLGLAEVQQAFTALEESRFVFGPSPDGGVYLIGAAAAVADLFAGVRWRTPAVLRDLLARTTAEAVLLRALADVDDAQGLARLETDPTVDIEFRRVVRSIRRPARPQVVRGAARPCALLLASPADPRGPPAFA